jgi:uncharacterized protein (TIGR02996 family)
MSDRAAFLRAIIEKPDDDNPRDLATIRARR